ncbi:MAG TPA: DUF5694 domain-containing protein [Tahibacter sp.]|uniref:DUF5694 domain-containing protein n=1 Tax=Tahibacter sp. TaxID=2056211 RepID=UPI002B5B8514|nr:DUF5694 domain-containing protein [Tahibacter sp.]HSX59667.1 DUF5694 domain-containing protein [Tahibacter sp.]
MLIRRLCRFGLCLLLVPPASLAEPAPAPVDVMIVGVFHMSNPGKDIHNLKVDDMLSPARQAEIAAVTEALARFRPNRIDVEWPKAVVEERYAKYLDGSLPPSRNEVVQLGFRLAKDAGAKSIHGIDVDGDFPYEALKTYADANGFGALLAAQGAIYDRQNAEQERLLASKGVGAALRHLNDPARLRNDNFFYRTALRIGAGDTQPGVDLLTAWYRRNFLICAELLQRSQPGDRIVVFYGAGHSFLLRQCVAETPGFRLVEAIDYLPK